MLFMTYLVISHEVHIRYAAPFPEIHASTNSAFLDGGPCQVGLVFRLSASHTVGRGFASLPGHTKDHHQLDCLKGRVVCGTVCGDMNLIFPEIHRKSRVLYPGSGFLSSATWPSLPKKTHTIMD